jgi:hypothetical protein
VADNTIGEVLMAYGRWLTDAPEGTKMDYSEASRILTFDKAEAVQAVREGREE